MKIKIISRHWNFVQNWQWKCQKYSFSIHHWYKYEKLYENGKCRFTLKSTRKCTFSLLCTNDFWNAMSFLIFHISEIHKYRNKNETKRRWERKTGEEDSVFIFYFYGKRAHRIMVKRKIPTAMLEQLLDFPLLAISCLSHAKHRKYSELFVIFLDVRVSISAFHLFEYNFVIAISV